MILASGMAVFGVYRTEAGLVPLSYSIGWLGIKSQLFCKGATNSGLSSCVGMETDYRTLAVQQLN